MKNVKKLIVVMFLITLIAFMGFSQKSGQNSSAQTSLVCIPQTQTVNAGQTATFTATGGTGVYNWSSPGVSSISGSAVYNVVFSNTGTKVITVTSGTETATCTLYVNPAGTVGVSAPLTCSPSSQHVLAGQSVTLTASGGPGGFVWYAPGIVLPNNTAQTISVTYSSPGTNVISVLSGTQSASCTLIVDPIAGTSGTGNLMCSPASQTANVGQSVTFTASGGSGSYTWSAPEVTLSNPTGSGFTVNYLTSGVKTISVTSAGQTANCQLTVLAPGGATGGNLACSPSTQTTYIGQPVTFTASGGNGNYTWAAPEVTLNNPTGSGFTLNYFTAGMKTISVMSAGQTANCTLNVLSSTTLPGTGEGGARYFSKFLRLLGL